MFTLGKGDVDSTVEALRDYERFRNHEKNVNITVHKVAEISKKKRKFEQLADARANRWN